MWLLQASSACTAGRTIPYKTAPTLQNLSPPRIGTHIHPQARRADDVDWTLAEGEGVVAGALLVVGDHPFRAEDVILGQPLGP